MRHILDGTIARRNFITSLGGVAAVSRMPHEARADAFEAALMAGAETPQSANKALPACADEEVILACLVHDTVRELIHTDYGRCGAQLYEPYLPASAPSGWRH